MALAPSASSHPILKGVDITRLVGHGSLYKVSPLAKGATPLLIGTIPGQDPEPIAWVIAPGGLLATFSCSGGVSADLFQSIIAGAALDAGAEAKIIERFGAAADHPVALEFPEGDYLKGLLLLKS